MIDTKKVIKLVISAEKFVNDESLRNAVSMKGEADFVTQVDLSISEYLKSNLHYLYPEIYFMSEEDDKNDLEDNRWILDPIDGTTNLVFDYKMSSISLALMKNREIVFGVVYNPFSKELFTAEKGKGAFLNGKKIYTVDRDIKNSLIEFGAGSTHKELAKQTFDLAESIFTECLDLRRICSSALAICYVACGRLNGYFEKVLKPWDYGAGSLILSESGGKATDFKGNKLQFDEPSSIICGTNKVYDFLYKKINE